MAQKQDLSADWIIFLGTDSYYYGKSGSSGKIIYNGLVYNTVKNSVTGSLTGTIYDDTLNRYEGYIAGVLQSYIDYDTATYSGSDIKSSTATITNISTTNLTGSGTISGSTVAATTLSVTTFNPTNVNSTNVTGSAIVSGSTILGSAVACSGNISGSSFSGSIPVSATANTGIYMIRNKLNFIQGTHMSVQASDDSTNDRVDITFTNTASVASPSVATVYSGSFLVSGSAELTVIEFPLTTDRLIHNILLDLNELTQNATIRLYSKIDGTNYRALDDRTISWVTTDDDGLSIDPIATNKYTKVTIQSASAEAATRTGSYRAIVEDIPIFTVTGSGGESSGCKGSYNLIIYSGSGNGGPYFLNDADGNAIHSGSVASTLINSAWAHLTSGRTWKEKVILRGVFTIDAAITPSSYTILELQGVVKLGNAANVDLLTMTGKTHVEIYGGEWDGNKANQTGDLQGFIIYTSTYINVHDTIVHDIHYSTSQGDGMYFNTCSYCTIQSNKVYNCGTVGTVTGGGSIMMVNCGPDMEVSFNEVWDSNAGIYLYTGTSGVSRDCRIIGNFVYGIGRDGISLYPEGASSYVMNNVVANNVIEDATTDAGHNCIKIGYHNAGGGSALHNIIEGNIMRDSVGYGITIYNQSPTEYNLINGNYFYNITKTSIAAANDHNTITNNYIHNPGSYGISLTGNYQKISGNHIYNCTSGAAIMFGVGSYNLVSDNYIDTVAAAYNGIDASNASSTNSYIINNYLVNIVNATEISLSAGNVKHNNYEDGTWVA